MKKIFIAIVIVLVASIGFADEQLATQKKAVFKSLEKLQVSTDLSTGKYKVLLADAKTEFNIYSRMEDTEKSGYSCVWALDNCISNYRQMELVLELIDASYGNASNFLAEALRDKSELLKKGQNELDKAYKDCFPSK